MQTSRNANYPRVTRTLNLAVVSHVDLIFLKKCLGLQWCHHQNHQNRVVDRNSWWIGWMYFRSFFIKSPCCAPLIIRPSSCCFFDKNWEHDPMVLLLFYSCRSKRCGFEHHHMSRLNSIFVEHPVNFIHLIFIQLTLQPDSPFSLLVRIELTSSSSMNCPPILTVLNGLFFLHLSISVMIRGIYIFLSCFKASLILEKSESFGMNEWQRLHVINFNVLDIFQSVNWKRHVPNNIIVPLWIWFWFL